MIYVAVADANDFLENQIKINAKVIKRIEKSSSESEKKIRATAYHAMFLLLERFCSDGWHKTQKLDLCYTDAGKPYFEQQKNENKGLQKVPSISISHDKNVAVAVISDAEKIGIDIQGDSVPKRRMERIAARFFTPINKAGESSEGIDEEIQWFLAKGDRLLDINEGFSKKELREEKESFDFLAKWTKLEAVIKASGGGFLDYPQLEELLPTAKTKTFVLTKEKSEYVITIAK